MKRVAAPLVRTVGPVITQIPGNLPSNLNSESLESRNKIILNRGWDDSIDREVFSGRFSDNDSTTTTTTTTTSFTNSSRNNEHVVIADSKDINARLDKAYDALEQSFSTNPIEAAIFEVAKDITNNKELNLVNTITNFSSFHRLANAVSQHQSSGLNRSQSNQIEPRTVSMSTQTDEQSFEETFTTMQEVAMQIISPTPEPVIATSTLTTNSTPTSTSSTTTGPISTQVPPPVNPDMNPNHSSDPTEGSAGVPGESDNTSQLVRVVIPLAILAVVAVAALPFKSAAQLIHTAIKYASRILVK